MDNEGTLGFIGLGVMGAPMCRNLALKSGAAVAGYDVRPEPLEALAGDGVAASASAGEVAERAGTIFLSLPGDDEVRAVCLGAGGLLERGRAGQTVVDCSTTTVALSHELASRFAAKGMAFADAPVARTRQAAIEGTLSVMVGAEPEVFAAIRPYLECVAADITHCGGPGAGQAVKLINNMVLFQTVGALAEALALGRRAGLDGRLLFETLAKGSADSFALRNHGIKAMLPGEFPEQAFSTRYAIKDLSYALRLAEQCGLALDGGALAMRRFEESVAAGNGDLYFPAVIKVVDEDGAGA